jgi:hypothetical protein
MSDEERLDQGGEGYEWEGEPDLTSISEEELKARLKELDEEERALSYRRRVLQGRIDLIRAELVRRGGVVLSPADLARVLMGGEENRSGRLDLEGGGF